MKFVLTASIFLVSFFSSGLLLAQSNRVVDVIVQKVAVTQIQTPIEAIGSLRANESIAITANVNKKITAINFADGQQVKAGHILVEMTSHEERALLEEARINAEEAKKQWQRVQALTKTGAASQSLLDQRLREYEAAQARYNALESRLKDLLLQAPFAGVVGLRQVSVGALVSPGEVITTLNDDSKMKLDFTVPSVYLSSLEVGLDIKATTRALADRELHGQVTSIDNQIDTVTRAIKVRALLDNKNRELKQGMLMQVKLHTRERQAMVISESALMPLASNNFVFVVKKTDTNTWIVERRKIEIGERLVGRVEVVSGLNEDELLVTHGVQKLRNGQAVKILAEEKPQETPSANPVHLSDLLNTNTGADES
jgi:membrane fusion protein (multidrug efflux system)